MLNNKLKKSKLIMKTMKERNNKLINKIKIIINNKLTKIINKKNMIHKI